MIGVVMYGTNQIRGIRTVAARAYGDGPVARNEVVTEGGEEVDMRLGRDDTLRVMAATNTLIALAFVGVLVLQAGQWYAERKEGEEMEAIRKAEEEEKRKDVVVEEKEEKEVRKSGRRRNVKKE